MFLEAGTGYRMTEIAQPQYSYTTNTKAHGAHVGVLDTTLVGIEFLIKCR